MEFVNNWQQPITLGISAVAATLDLPDGTFRLTIADAVGQAATRWEYVDAVVVDTAATLTRGLEGTPAQAWLEGSVIYCPLSAGVLNGLFQQLAELAGTVGTQAEQIANLEDRVSALEPVLPTVLDVTVGLGGGSYSAGFYGETSIGSCSPATVDVPTFGDAEIKVAIFWNDTPKRFSLYFAGNFSPALISSVDVEGAGTLLFADATLATNESSGGVWSTLLEWELPSTDWFASSGLVRQVAITFA